MTAMLLSLLLFALAASFSPGPNNIMVMGMTATRGFGRTIPFACGVVLGFGFMVASVGIGLSAPLARYPALAGVMRWAGAIWLLVLAWKIGSAPGTVPDNRAALFGFWNAVGFQWVNPKAWIMAVAAASAFVLPGLGPVSQSLLRAAVFTLVGVASISSWMMLGLGVGRFLATEKRLRAFNLAMGVLLAVSVVPALLE